MDTPPPTPHPRRLLALALTLLAAPAPTAPRRRPRATPAPARRPPGRGAGTLTNLDHLDWLSETVRPPDQAGHTTTASRRSPYRRAVDLRRPTADGGFRHVGGGTYDPATDT